MLNLLEADSIRKEFGFKQVLTDISVRCQTGDIIGLLGRNGSGKSTLLKIIFGTLFTDYKFIRINGAVFDQPFKTRNMIGYLNQDNFLPKHITVKHAAELYSDGFDPNKFLEDDILEKVSATKIKNLSGGEARYLEVKLLLNLDTLFVMLDEPFNGLSPLHVDILKVMIRKASEKKGILLTDHDYRNVIDVATKHYLLFDGGLKTIKTNQDLIDWGYVPEPK
jgi:lipopolysaccharide export system ATP-binding protein